MREGLHFLPFCVKKWEWNFLYDLGALQGKKIRLKKVFEKWWWVEILGKGNEKLYASFWLCFYFILF